MKRASTARFSTPVLRKTLLFLSAPIVLAIAVAQSSSSGGYVEANGDFILGFREVGSTTSILVNLGPITDFTAAQSFSLGSLGSLLSSNYGSDWATNVNVYFSLAATDRPGDTADTDYVTSAAYPPDDVPAKIWSRSSGPVLLGLQKKIGGPEGGCGTDFNAYPVQSGTNAVVEPSTDPAAYQEFMPGGSTDSGHATQANIAWGLFEPTTEGNFHDGAGGVVLHLIQLVPGSGPGTDLGDFVLSADGSTLTFTPASLASSTPSPSPGQTPTPSPGQTPTPAPTPTPGQTPTPTPPAGPTPTPTPAPTPTPTPSPTPTPTPAPPAFFNGQELLGNGVYYLAFPNGNFFSYYSFLSDPQYIYHFDLGYEYLFDANDGQGGLYLYDFASSSWFYTSPGFPFPYLYDFSLDAFLYYYPDVPADGRYTHNPRYFYDLTHGMIITM